jgi:hypothetical protein
MFISRPTLVSIPSRALILEVDPGMSQKSMVKVVETQLIGDYMHIRDPLDKTQRNLALDRRAQDDLGLPLDCPA